MCSILSTGRPCQKKLLLGNDPSRRLSSHSASSSRKQRVERWSKVRTAFHIQCFSSSFVSPPRTVSSWWRFLRHSKLRSMSFFIGECSSHGRRPTSIVSCGTFYPTRYKCIPVTSTYCEGYTLSHLWIEYHRWTWSSQHCLRPRLSYYKLWWRKSDIGHYHCTIVWRRFPKWRKRKYVYFTTSIDRTFLSWVMRPGSHPSQWNCNHTRGKWNTKWSERQRFASLNFARLGSNLRSRHKKSYGVVQQSSAENPIANPWTKIQSSNRSPYDGRCSK